MASGGLFQHTDPFHDDQVQHPQEAKDSEPAAASTEPAEPAEEVDDAAQLRLAGVRSHNPFAASTDEHAQDGGNPDVEQDELAKRDQASIDKVMSNNSGSIPEPSPTSPISPGTALSDGAALNQTLSNQDIAAEDHVGPLESESGGSEHAEADHAASSDSNLQTVNSNVNNDRAERGTDVFAVAAPPTPEESPGHSRSGSSDDMAKEKASFSGRDQQPRVGFAGEDKIDAAEKGEIAHSSDDDDSGGILDKIKSAAKDKFHLIDMKTTGPFKRLNPTSARIRASVGGGDDAKEVGIIWRSRDNRKGRNSVVIPRTSMAYPNLPPKNRPVYSSSFKGVGRNLYRMAFSFPVSLLASIPLRQCLF